MADDPRIDLAAVRRDIIRANDPDVQGEGRRVVESRVRYAAAALLDEVERLAPLRALLADEDRAVELIREAIAKSDGGTLSSRHLSESARAVLAALREVAGLQNGPDQLAADQGRPDRTRRSEIEDTGC